MIKCIMFFYIGLFIGCVISIFVCKEKNKKIGRMNDLATKHLDMFFLMNQWVKNYQDHKQITSFFTSNGYRKVAIYGMSYIGLTLLDELNKCGIKVEYGIDKKKDVYADLEILSPDDYLPDVDIIIVTAIACFNDIKKKLSAKINCPIISIETIIYK